MSTEKGNDNSNNKVFANNLNRFMKIKNVERHKLANDLDFKYTTVCDWCNGKVIPKMDKVDSLAEYLGVKKSDLIEEYIWDRNARLSNMEKHVVRVPLLGRIPAGIPIEAIEDEYTIDYEEVPADWKTGNKEYFALKITGDSMEPQYNDGDVVVFLKTPMCLSGQDCCIRINGSDATFKRVTIKEEGIILSPLNLENSTGFLPKLYTKEEIESLPIEILGVAKKLIKYL